MLAGISPSPESLHRTRNVLGSDTPFTMSGSKISSSALTDMEAIRENQGQRARQAEAQPAGQKES